MYIFKSCLITVIVAIQCSTLHTCGIAVHNEVTYRSLENFIPRTDTQQIYKNDILDSASYSQAGSFFPDWGYQCLGYNQQSEDAHWPTFIKTAVNYIRQVYPISDFHSDPHVKGLISFVFAIMSHGMADVKWHSLSGLSDYFIVAMANSDFHGDTKDSHLAADAGAEFTLRHSNKLSYLNETWQVPVKDIIEIYTRLYASEEEEESAKKKRIPLASHIQYCMTAAFAASKIDVEFGQFMFGYYGSKSPFLTEELYDYYKGGIEDMSATVSDCYAELIDAFEQGLRHTYPDTLCASYFYTSLGDRRTRNQCLKHPIKAQSRIPSTIYKDYNSNTGILTLTTKQQKQKELRHDDTLPPVVDIIVSQTSSHYNNAHRQQPQLQRILKNDRITKLLQTTRSKGRCISLGEKEDAISSITLTIPMSSARVGHQITTGDFNGNGEIDMAISAPFHYHDTMQEQTGAVFLLNQTLPSSSQETTSDIRDVSKLILQGDVPHGRFGWSMTSIDINQDGIDDLAISTLTNNNNNGASGKIEIYCGRANLGLDDVPRIKIRFQEPELLASVLAAIDMNQDGFKDLVIGCPLCSVGNQPQVGMVYIFKSNPGICSSSTNQQVLTNPDIQIENPNAAEYDHFGGSILRVKDTLLISAPGFSIGNKQRVGRVYAFDINTQRLKWTITGTNEFQQFGRVMATDKNNDILAISSPSEEIMVGLQKFWQGGAVRIYNWNELQSSIDDQVDDIQNYDMEHGMISMIKGRTNAGHLGQSISFFENDLDKGIWIGEPMSERENGRVYRWLFDDENNGIECIRNNQVVLARFGSQIGSLGKTDAICITSQRYGQNARYSGAVTFLQQTR